jgi:hypothetical protein
MMPKVDHVAVCGWLWKRSISPRAAVSQQLVDSRPFWDLPHLASKSFDLRLDSIDSLVILADRYSWVPGSFQGCLKPQSRVAEAAKRRVSTRLRHQETLFSEFYSLEFVVAY